MASPINSTNHPGFAFSVSTGIATLTSTGRVLDTWFPEPKLSQEPEVPGVHMLSAGDVISSLGSDYEAFLCDDPVRAVHRVAVRVVSDLRARPRDIYDLYLRLHLLSHRLIAPHGAALGGFMNLLCGRVAWTSIGPVDADELQAVRRRAQNAGLPLVMASGVFSLPPLLDYMCPPGVSIADRTRVLLGAHLAAGTMVTPEGFCGINAGTLGPCMIEGRVSGGVVIGAGSHVGGGASIMGTMSGGNRHVITIGERCLLGANSGVGISLGADCIVEAGCYVTSGMKVALPSGRSVKAEELAGRPGLLFRRHSQSGRLEAIKGHAGWSGLNPVLHRF